MPYLGEAGIKATADVKHNLAAGVDPIVTDDINAGYEQGSRWLNASSNEEFVLVDATAGAAVWERTTAATDASDVPFTPAGGIVATDVQAAIVEVNSGHTFRGALIHGSSTKNDIVYNTWTILNNITTVDFDTNSFNSGSGRLTIPVGVNYIQLNAHVQWGFSGGSNASDPWMGLQFAKNGSSMSGLDNSTTKLNGYHPSNPNLTLVSHPLPVTPGDYFEVEVRQKVHTTGLGSGTITRSNFSLIVLG